MKPATDVDMQAMQVISVFEEDRSDPLFYEETRGGSSCMACSSSSCIVAVAPELEQQR